MLLAKKEQAQERHRKWGPQGRLRCPIWFPANLNANVIQEFLNEEIYSEIFSFYLKILRDLLVLPLFSFIRV